MWYKWGKRLIAGVGVFFALLFGIATLIVYLYEDEIKQYAVKELNKKLIVPIDIEGKDIELTLFSQFPSASLRFNNLFIPDLDKQDTLLYAESLYLNFDFWDMIDGDYRVKEIETENSVIKLRIDSLGAENYLIWKKEPDNKEEEKFSFVLEEVSFDNVRLDYSNQLTKQNYKIKSEDILFSGNFSESNYSLSASSEFFINQFESNTVSYISDKNASANLVLNINTDSSLYQLEKAEFSVEDLLFDMEGKYTNNQDSSYLDLVIKGRNIDLQTAFSIFPKEYFETLSKYNATGMVAFETTIKGMIGKNSSPTITSEFKLTNGSLTEKNTGTHLQQLSLEGYFENKNTKRQEQLKLQNISGLLDKGNIEGNITVTNFTKPSLIVELKGDLSLAKVKQFLNSENIEILDGNTSFDIQFSGIFNSALPLSSKIKTSNGFVKFNNVSLKTVGSHLAIADLKGKFSLIKNDATFSNLTGKLLSTQFKANGTLKNFLPYLLLDNQQLVIETNFRSKSVDLNELMVSKKTEGSVQPTPLSFPTTIDFKLITELGNLTYGKFNATNVKGVVILKNKKLSAQNVTFKANSGTYIVSTQMEQTESNTFSWTTDATASGIDIENFFVEFNDFGQDFLTHKNIKGKATVQVSMKTVMDGYMKMNLDQLYSTVNISITKGELINQSSLLEIAEYLESNKLTKSAVDTKTLKKKLQHVKFSNLENRLLIEKGKVNIPKMEIATNVMTLGISGVHGFDDNVDYHLNFRLKDVLVKDKSKEEEFGPIKDDGLGMKLFLHMYGNLSNLKYEIDKEEKKVARKEAVQEEKQDVKSVLKDEFGLFAKDSTVKAHTEEKEEPTFAVEWEEFDEEPVVEEEKKETEKEKKGLNKFLKKLGVEEEEKKKVEVTVEE